MNQTARDVPAAVQACHELLAWIIPQLDKMPRLRRYTLGERVETLLLQVLENLIEASYSKSSEYICVRCQSRRIESRCANTVR